MRNGLLAALVGLVIMCSMSAAPAMAADATWSKGNSWDYTWSADMEEMFNMTGSIEMKVTQSTADTYVLTLSGAATTTGSFMNMTVSGNVDITGSMTRAKSTFGVMSTTLIMNMSVTMLVATVTIEMGFMTTATPPLGDLPINQALTPGTHIWSNSSVTGTFWLNMVGFENTTETISSTEHLELVVGANETVTTPAGTFECVKLTVGSGSNATTYYYSDKVGNYVKVSGAGTMGTGYGALGGLTLKSYSYGGSSGVMSLITGKYWWVTALIIVVVVVIIIGVLVLRRKGRTQQVAPPPIQQMPPPPQS